MYSLLKLVRKLGKMVRGGVSPSQIVLGALLGVFIGFMPGFNLALLLAVVALVVLNAHLGTALLGVAIGRVCALLLAPVSFRLGMVLIHGRGLEGVFRHVVNAPVLALLGLDRYCMTGSLPLVVLVGGLWAYAVVKLVGTLRLMSDASGAPGGILHAVASHRAAALLIRIVFGRGKEEADLRRPLLRTSGLALVAVAALLVLAADLLALGMGARWAGRSVLGRLNGAEVNIERVSLSLLRGRVGVRGLELTDPARPDRNRFQVDVVEGDLSLGDLLARRLVISELVLSGVHTGRQRAEEGRVYAEPPVVEPAPSPDPDERRVLDYFQDSERIERWLRGAYEQLRKQRERSRERAAVEDAPARFLLETAENLGYMKVSASELLRAFPAVTVRTVRIGDISAGPPLDRHALEAFNVSSAPWILGSPVDIQLRDLAQDGDSPAVRIRLNLHDVDQPHELSVNLSGLPIGRGAGIVLSESAPVHLEDARAAVEAAGVFEADRLDIDFRVALSEADLDVGEGQGLFGLDPQVSRQLVSSLTSLALYGRLHGRLRSPRVRIDAARTLGALQDGLKSTGKTMLRDMIESELGDVEGLLRPRRRDDDDREREDSEERGPEVLDRIRRLF